MSLDQETINAQLDLLAAHRRTLAHLLIQQAQFSVGHIPAHVANGITEARANIARIKAYLYENGVRVDDEPNDEASPTTSFDAIEATGKTAERRALDAVLEIYLDRMSELLIDKNLLKSKTGDELRAVARMRTLTALKRLDGEHNQILIQFLQDAGLFGKQDIPHTHIISLCGVDLQGVDLRGVNLSRVSLRKALLGRANLQKANLFEANLMEAVLIEANLREACLWNANLREAVLAKADLRGAMLGGANLQKANLYRARVGKYGLNSNSMNLQGAFILDISTDE